MYSLFLSNHFWSKYFCSLKLQLKKSSQVLSNVEQKKLFYVKQTIPPKPLKISYKPALKTSYIFVIVADLRRIKDLIHTLELRFKRETSKIKIFEERMEKTNKQNCSIHYANRKMRIRLNMSKRSLLLHYLTLYFVISLIFGSIFFTNTFIFWFVIILIDMF